MKRADILKRAEECVCGHREQDYGSPEDNFQAIADLWTGYFKGEIEYTPVDVAMMMALMKIARVHTGTATDDSFVDIAGYAACGGEIVGIQKDKQESWNRIISRAQEVRDEKTEPTNELKVRNEIANELGNVSGLIDGTYSDYILDTYDLDTISLAEQVLNGYYGDGRKRKKNLQRITPYPERIQECVNDILKEKGEDNNEN